MRNRCDGSGKDRCVVVVVVLRTGVVVVGVGGVGSGGVTLTRKDAPIHHI